MAGRCSERPLLFTAEQASCENPSDIPSRGLKRRGLKPAQLTPKRSTVKRGPCSPEHDVQPTLQQRDCEYTDFVQRGAADTRQECSGHNAARGADAERRGSD